MKLGSAPLWAGAFCAGAWAIAGVVFADGPPKPTPDVAAPPVRAAPLPPATVQPAAAPQGQTGAIALMEGQVALNVPASYRYYPAAEANGDCLPAVDRLLGIFQPG